MGYYSIHDGAFKTVTGKVEPVTIADATMKGPVLYHTDTSWMEIWTLMCDCHGLVWFGADIWSGDGRGLMCPLYTEVTP